MAGSFLLSMNIIAVWWSCSSVHIGMALVKNNDLQSLLVSLSLFLL